MFCDFVEDKDNPNLKICSKCGFKINTEVEASKIKAACKVMSEIGILKKAANFAKAVSTQIIEGNPICTQEEINARLAICLSCEFFVIKQQVPLEGTCSKCGCSCNSKTNYLNKLYYGSQHCPIEKW